VKIKFHTNLFAQIMCKSSPGVVD